MRDSRLVSGVARSDLLISRQLVAATRPINGPRSAYRAILIGGKSLPTDVRNASRSKFVVAQGERKDHLMYDALPARLYYNGGRLPHSNIHEPQQAERDSSPEKPAVLVVDDHETIREVLAVILEEGGYRVHEAADGGPALQQLRASREPMVVLLDVEMPGMDGFQVMQAVATDTALATRHAYVLVTANAETLSLAFLTLLRRLGVPVIPKPFDIDELLEAVTQAVARLGQRLA